MHEEENSLKDEDEAPFLLEFKDFHEIADTLPSEMLPQESNINGLAGNSGPSLSGESLENFVGGPRTIMVPSSRFLSRYEEQRHPPRSKSPYLLQPEDLPPGAGSMHHMSSSKLPDNCMTRQTQEHNDQQYSASPDQQFPKRAEHDDGPRGAPQSPYQASVQATVAAQQMRLPPTYFGGQYRGNNLNRPGHVTSQRIIPLLAAAAVPILVSPPQISFTQPPWGSTTVDPRTLPSNHFPIPPGMEVVLADHQNAGTKRKYRVEYKCYSMTQEKAHRYIESLSQTGVWIPPTAVLRTAPQKAPGNSSNTDDRPPSKTLWADQLLHHQRRCIAIGRRSSDQHYDG